MGKMRAGGKLSNLLAMSSSNSISEWISSLKERDAEAVQVLWNRFSAPLLEHARRKLSAAPRGMVDEEDITQSVFRSLWRGAISGRFEDIKNRDDLWWLLLAITKQKVVDHIRRESAQKRGGGRVATEVALGLEATDAPFALDWLIGDVPTPDFLVMLQEQNDRLLGLLRDDRLRNVAVSRIEGYTVPEIAHALAISTRSVERKLQLIRKAWAKDFSLVD
jgi:DNA-directed RNA polymerase specialized sigma24 family protein